MLVRGIAGKLLRNRAGTVVESCWITLDGHGISLRLSCDLHSIVVCFDLTHLFVCGLELHLQSLWGDFGRMLALI